MTFGSGGRRSIPVELRAHDFPVTYSATNGRAKVRLRMAGGLEKAAVAPQATANIAPVSMRLKLGSRRGPPSAPARGNLPTPRAGAIDRPSTPGALGRSTEARVEA